MVTMVWIFNTPLYNLATFSKTLILPLYKQILSIEVLDNNNQENDSCVSFTSFFTNTPLNETSNIT